MRYGSVKHIALYYKAIPGMLRLLRQDMAADVAAILFS